MLTLGGKPLQVPILQGGMGVGVSLGGLAGAVAACGGMGCISTADAGYREPDFARDPAAANHRALTAEIQKAKAIAGGMGLVAINAMVATRDYAEAIRTAAMLSRPGDILLIAGKGHETYQIIGDVKHHFDDKEEVGKAFGTLRN